MKKLLFVFLLVPFLTIAQPSDPSGDPDKDIVEMVEETKDIIKKRIEEFNFL